MCADELPRHVSAGGCIVPRMLLWAVYLYVYLVCKNSSRKCTAENALQTARRVIHQLIQKIHRFRAPKPNTVPCVPRTARPVFAPGDTGARRIPRGASSSATAAARVRALAFLPAPTPPAAAALVGRTGLSNASSGCCGSPYCESSSSEYSLVGGLVGGWCAWSLPCGWVLCMCMG